MDMSYADVNKRYKHRFEEFDALTADTGHKALEQLTRDPGGVIQDIIYNNSLDCYHREGLIPDLKQELMLIMINYLQRDGDEKFLSYYNKKAELRFWLTRVCQYSFKSNNSQIYKQYFVHKNYSFSSTDDLEYELPDILEPADDILLSQNSWQIMSDLATILSSPKAQTLFKEEELGVFWYYFSQKKNNPKYRIANLSRDTEIDRDYLGDLIDDIKDFVLMEMEYRNNQPPS